MFYLVSSLGEAEEYATLADVCVRCELLLSPMMMNLSR